MTPEEVGLTNTPIHYKGVPAEFIGPFLPPLALSVRELVQFPLHQLCLEKNDLSSASLKWSNKSSTQVLGLDLVKAFTLPPTATVTAFLSAAPADAKSISVNGVLFPRTISIIWNAWCAVCRARTSWTRSLKWLETAQKREKTEAALFNQCLDILSTLQWSGPLYGFTVSAQQASVTTLTRFLSDDWLAATDLNHLCELLSDEMINMGLSALVVGMDWFTVVSRMHKDSLSSKELNPRELRRFHQLGQRLASGKVESVGGIVNIRENHWIAFVIDPVHRVILIGDSLLPGGVDALKTGAHSVVLRSLRWMVETFIPTSSPTSSPPYDTALLPISTQRDTILCGMFAFNALQRFYLLHAVPRLEFGSMRIPRALLFLDVHLKHSLSFPDSIIPSTAADKNDDDDDDDGFEIIDPNQSSSPAISSSNNPPPPPPTKLANRPKIRIRRSSDVTKKMESDSGLFQWFKPVSQAEYDRQRTEGFSKIRAEAVVISEREAEAKEAAVELRRENDRLRQQKSRAGRKRARAGKEDGGTQKKTKMAVFAPDHGEASSTYVAQHSRARVKVVRTFRPDDSKPHPGRKRTVKDKVVTRVDWTAPLLIREILEVSELPMYSMEKSPTEMVRALRARSRVFSTLQPSVLGRYFERKPDGTKGLKASIDERIARNASYVKMPATRQGVLKAHPDLVQHITSSLTGLRLAGAAVSVQDARAIMIALIAREAPSILTRVGADGSKFTASSPWVRKFLKETMGWSIRKSTRAAQKIPEKAELYMHRSAVRQAYSISEYDIPSALRVNSDQTQVVLQGGGQLTWNPAGAKQVTVYGHDEKRAFTLVVGVAADGALLPFQAVWQGTTTRSLPKPDSPGYARAMQLGMKFVTSGTNTYWSTFGTMQLYVKDILHPHYQTKKEELSLPPEQEAIWQIDVWSVHSSIEFRTWMAESYSYIILEYVPGGCTGQLQPCDVGMQRPLKQAITRAQSADVINEVSALLESGTQPDKVTLDQHLGTLRNRSPSWLLDARETCSAPELVKAAFRNCSAGALNLSHESLTSSEARRILIKLPKDDPKFYAELTAPRQKYAPATDPKRPRASSKHSPGKKGSSVEDSSVEDSDDDFIEDEEPIFFDSPEDDENIPTADIIQHVLSNGDNLGAYVERNGGLSTAANDAEDGECDEVEDGEIEAGAVDVSKVETEGDGSEPDETDDDGSEPDAGAIEGDSESDFEPEAENSGFIGSSMKALALDSDVAMSAAHGRPKRAVKKVDLHKQFKFWEEK